MKTEGLNIDQLAEQLSTIAELWDLGHLRIRAIGGAYRAFFRVSDNDYQMLESFDSVHDALKNLLSNCTEKRLNIGKEDTGVVGVVDAVADC